MNYKFNNICDCCGNTKTIKEIERIDLIFVNEFGYICKDCYEDKKEDCSDEVSISCFTKPKTHNWRNEILATLDLPVKWMDKEKAESVWKERKTLTKGQCSECDSNKVFLSVYMQTVSAAEILLEEQETLSNTLLNIVSELISCLNKADSEKLEIIKKAINILKKDK